MKDVNLSKEEIISRITYFRNKKNMSAYKLGMELGHSKNYFYRIESGEITLTLDMLLEILDILNISTTQFFCPDLDNKDEEILKVFDELTNENKQTLLDLAKKLK